MSSGKSVPPSCSRGSPCTCFRIDPLRHPQVFIIEAAMPGDCHFCTHLLPARGAATAGCHTRLTRGSLSSSTPFPCFPAIVCVVVRSLEIALSRQSLLRALRANLGKPLTTRTSVLICALLLAVSAAAQSNRGISPSSPADDPQKSQLPPTYVPSGKTMYKQFCAACHGADGKGRGPATPTLNTRVPDLTTLAKRHDGKFPTDYVTSVLRFGPGFSAHGSSEMPVWARYFSTWKTTMRRRFASASRTFAITSRPSRKNRLIDQFNWKQPGVFS